MWKIWIVYVVLKDRKPPKLFVLDRIPSRTQSNFVGSEGNLPHFYLGSWVTKSYVPV